MKEDLACMYNTVALFLEHQKFTKTCAVFREECNERGFNNIRNKHTFNCPSEMSAEGEYDNEKYDENDSMYSKELLDAEYKSPHITYNFEEENSTEVSISRANFGTSTGHSVDNEHYGLLSDYLNLKEKFIDLQNQYKTLMHELEEKTKVLDNTITLLKDSKGIFEKDVAVISLRNQNSSMDVKASAPRNCEIVLENKNSQKLGSLINDETKTDSDICTSNGDNKYCQEIEDCDHKARSQSISSNDGRIRSSSSKSSRTETLQIAEEDDKPIVSTLNGHKYPSLERRTYDNVNFPTQEVSFLFTRRKCHQTHSAPNRMNDHFGYDLNIYQTCISTPLSAKKDSFRSQYFPLNFSKVKEDLRYGKRDVKVLLLQALRWRLTQSSYTERGSVIYSYIQSDLLDLRREKSIMDLLSQETNDKEFIEGLARLMNTIVSLKEGRDYICSSKNQVRSNIVSSVSKQLETSSNISISLEMQIVILQKLSIRKEQRKVMIVNGLLQSISKLLINRRRELSAYCMEYTFGLFMNLCLEEEAKLKCSEDPSYIIRVFFCLLDEVQDNYMPYVTGALYSILSEKSVEEEALRQDLDVLLFRQMKSTRDKYLRKQLEFIIRARFRGEGAKFTCNENVPSEEIDILEPELDRNDIVRGPVQGEKFLEMYRLNKAHSEVTNKCNGCTEVKSSSETKDNTSQTESQKSIGVVEEGTNMDTNDPICKIEAAKIKFDAEISTSTENLDAFQNTIPVGSLLEYAQKYRPDVLPPTLGPCSCLGRAKYNCECYDAIKRSVDEDEELVGIVLEGNKLQSDEKISNEVNPSMLENCSNKQQENGLPNECIEMAKKS